MRFSLEVFVLGVALSGCDLLGTSGGEAPELITDRGAYVVEDTARVGFRNDENELAALSLCDAFLERQVGLGWVSVPNERGCNLILLAPSTESLIEREVVLREFVQAEGVEEGTYRFSGIVAFVNGEAVSEERRVSNAFRLSE